MFKRFVPACFALAVLSLIAGCGKNPGVVDGAQGPPAMPVKIQAAELVPVEDATEYVATLKSRNSATISPDVEGKITAIYVKSGDHVAAGARLMEIDPLKQQATVASQDAARQSKLANLQYAQDQLNRIKKLYADGVSSKQDLDAAQTAYDTAKADVDSMAAATREQEVQLHYYQVKAPTSGVVGDIPVHVGDRVIVSTTLTTIDQPGNVEAYVNVPVERGPDLALGKTVEILDSDGKPQAESKITFISPRVDDQTQTILVKSIIDNKDGKLRPAQFARARVIWNTHPGLKIPVLAVNRLNGQFFVFVADGNDSSNLVAHQRRVDLGDIQGNDYVVLSGLKAGDRLVLSGTQFLFDGAKVKPAS
jgi:RND family efflux transporter MFP subunit